MCRAARNELHANIFLMPHRSSRLVVKPIKNLFVTPSDEVNALLMRMFVLYEDLRVEVYGARAYKIEQLDETGHVYRGIYMIRRSTITISEFTQTMERLDQLEEFRKLKALFEERHQRAWADGKAFLLEHKPFLQRLRHNCGGHLLGAVVEKVMARMHQDTVGFVRVNYTRDDRASLNFGFAYEVVALALDVQRQDDDPPQPYVERLFRTVKEAWEEILNVMAAMANELIVPRFGL